MPEQKYKTGEEPQYGDIVKGTPNGSADTIIAGIVCAVYEEQLSIAFLVLQDDTILPEVRRVYGTAPNFDLIHRNPRNEGKVMS